MDSKVLSLENISVVQSAIFISLSPEVLKEILCIPGSENDVCKLKYMNYRKAQWVDIVERKAEEILKRKLPKRLWQKVICFIPPIAFRILIWAEFHEGMLGLTRYYSLNFLRCSHFTFEGVIDDKKAAEDMMLDINLSIEQRYKLACFYCLEKYISSFFKKIVRSKKNAVFGPEDPKWMEKPEIVKYWTCELTGRVYEYNKNIPRYLCRLEKSINSGSKEAVKFFWEETCLISREDALIYGTVIVLNKLNNLSDWIVFRDIKFDDRKETWVPNYIYTDILCFFLSNMTESQLQKALEQNIYINRIYPKSKYPIIVLELFLFWPYQDYFLKTTALLWDFICYRTYSILLLKIGDKIKPYKRNNLLYGEAKSYDYKKLLIDFWSQSPIRFKRYVFRDFLIVPENGREVKTTTAVCLLLKLTSLETFTFEDEEIVLLILRAATSLERMEDFWTSMCIRMLKKEKHEIFDCLLKVFCKSEEESRKCKEYLGIFGIARDVGCYFLSYSRINAVKSLIKWLSFPEYLLNDLKEDIIYSKNGINHCRKLLSSSRHKDFEEFVQWLLPSKEKEIAFKKHLVSNLYEDLPIHRSHLPLEHFTSVTVPYLLSHFSRSKCPDIQAIKGIPTGITNVFGRAICEDLISGSSFQVIYQEEDSSVHVKTEFIGGQWERVDEFLSWSLLSKKKILAYKKSLFRDAGEVIYYNLIKAKQWKEAKRFLDWLGLSAADIKHLKEKALFQGSCWWLLHYLVFEHDDKINNLEDIDLLLRWHLTDKKTVIEFRDGFFECHPDCDEAGLKKFNMLIENYLADFDQEDIGQSCGNAEERFFKYMDGGCLKRKSSVFLQQKKFRLSSDGEKVLQNGKTVNSS